MTKLFGFISLMIWMILFTSTNSTNIKLHKLCCSVGKDMANNQSSHLQINVLCNNLQILNENNEYKQLPVLKRKMCQIFTRSCCSTERKKRLCLDGAEASLTGTCTDGSLTESAQIKSECCFCCQTGSSSIMERLPNCINYLKGRCPKSQNSNITTSIPITASHLTNASMYRETSQSPSTYTETAVSNTESNSNETSFSTDLPLSTHNYESTTQAVSTAITTTSLDKNTTNSNNDTSTQNSTSTLPPQFKCSPGQVWNSEKSVCMHTIISCPESLILHPLSKKCVPLRYPKVPCKKGFVYNQFLDKCQDIDECSQNKELCGDSRKICKNIIGSYKCSCKAGFEENSVGKCEDIDECFTTECPAYRSCINTIGSYRCGRSVPCGFGWKEDLETAECVDVNECVVYPDICGKGMKCHNIIGSHVCKKEPCPPNMIRNNHGVCKRCRSGYKFNKITQKCEDINECMISKYRCRDSEVCVNEIGRYQCYPKIDCYKGTRVSPNGTVCADIDECKERLFYCKPDQMCINTYASYRCVESSCAPSAKYDYRTKQCECLEGFKRLASGKCEDIDECREYDDICGTNYKCINKPGAYNCIKKLECPKGMFRPSKNSHCRDINECLSGERICGPNQRCRNTHRSYQCRCNRGFSMLANKTCADINECILFTQEEACPDLAARCVNTQGSYKCECPKGFYWSDSGQKCRDVNECREKYINGTLKAPCGKNHICQNSVGSYNCICNKGYYLDVYTRECKDINECDGKKKYCLNGKCINLIGGYKCVCPKGFKVNSDSNCEDINECQVYKDLCDDVPTQKLLGGTEEDKKCINFYGHFKCIANSCASYYTKTELGNGILCQLKLSKTCKLGDNNCLRNRPIQRELVYVEIQQNQNLYMKLAQFRTSNLPVKDMRISFRVMYAFSTQTGETLNVRDAFRFRKVKYRTEYFEILQTKRIPAPSEVLLQIETNSYVRNQFIGYTQSNLLIFFTTAEHYYN